ncbi:MAG TPA: M12 family metallopeptidase [Candidatus Dormibacteraeota bacterium]|nr:M12 family metallopeptidase [Candidatus Dormibacteraeota bacterium]
MMFHLLACVRRSCCSLKLGLCLTIFFAVLAPQSQGQEQSASVPQQHAYFDSTAKWPSPSIYVCLENPDDRFKTDIALVKTALGDSWEAASAVRFTGWEKCAPENAGVHILIDDSGPLALELGSRLDGMKSGIVLNFTFNKWGSLNCKSTHDFCVRSIAVHEFGHALGFAHEQNRPDAPGECQQLHDGPKGTIPLTPYDTQSVMNYCGKAKAYSNDGKLSDYDKEAVGKEYGLTPASSGREVALTIQ